MAKAAKRRPDVDEQTDLGAAGRALGARIRALRRARKLTAKRVADRAGLSASFIGQIEAGIANPSMASLKRIADVLECQLPDLFDGNADQGAAPALPAGPSRISDVRIVRQDQRKMMTWPGSRGTAYLLTPDLRRKLEIFLSEREPGHDTGEDYSHEGEEFGLILDGRLEVRVSGEVHVLEEGDSIYFSSTYPHNFRVVGRRTRVLWVVTPPSF